MPSRAETFEKVVDRILPQVDLLYVFLDNFSEIPRFLREEPKIVVNRSQEVGDFHAAGRCLALEALRHPSIVILIDDDILYPKDYVHKLVQALAEFNGEVIVGVHGRIFFPPYESYLQDVVSFHFAGALKHHTIVDELGAGTCAFLSSVITFNVREWERHDANDISHAIEAQKQGVQRVCIKRRKRWLAPYAQDQKGSLWATTRKDPSHKSALMRRLIELSGRMNSTPPSATAPSQEAVFSLGDGKAVYVFERPLVKLKKGKARIRMRQRMTILAVLAGLAYFVGYCLL
jgi:hypothetical protein